jgi:hypothetical protein
MCGSKNAACVLLGEDIWIGTWNVHKGRCIVVIDYRGDEV